MKCFIICIGILTYSHNQFVQCQLFSNASLPEVENIFPVEIANNYLHKYFGQEKVFLSIILCSSNGAQKYIQYELLINLLCHRRFHNFTFNIFDHIDGPRRERRRVINLIFTEDITSLRKILNNKTISTFHLRQTFLIYVTRDDQDTLDAASDIFGLVFQLGLLNVNLLLKHENSMKWSLYGYRPYTQNCKSIEVVQIGTFTQSNFTNQLNVSVDELFAQIQFNFNNCPLFIATFPLEPFVFISNLPNGTILYSGLDVTIVNEVSKAMRLRPFYLQVMDGKNRGTIFKNGTANGAMQMVIDGEVDMSIGSYALTIERVRLMACTSAYMYNANVFTFARHLIPASPMWRLMAPFGVLTWISVAILLCISILLILLSKRLSTQRRHFVIGGEVNRTPILNMFSIVIGNVIPNPRMAYRQYFGMFARTLAMNWMLFWLIVRNSYQGSLYQYLQIYQDSSPYDTVEKVRDSNVKINLLPSAMTQLPESFNKERFVVRELDGFTAINEIMNQSWNGVLYTNDVSVNYFNLIHDPATQVGRTKDIVRPHTPVFYFHKNSILAWSFDRKIQTCIESGLTLYWSSKYKAKKRKRSKIPKKLEIINILAILKIAGVMYLIAFIVFVMEILSKNHRCIKEIIDFFTY